MGKIQDNNMFRAAAIGSLDALAFYLDQGANPLAVNFQGESALSIAAKNGKTECVDHLAPLSDIFSIDKFGANALLTACIKGHQACAALLWAEMDKSPLPSSGWTPLMSLACMARFGRPWSDDLAKIATLGTALDIDIWGRDALMAACLCGDEPAVATLLPHSNPWSVDRKGKCSLDHAIGLGLSKEENNFIVQTILNSLDLDNLQPQSADRFNKALHAAAIADNDNAVRSLLRFIQADGLDTLSTPLMMSAFAGSARCSKILLEAGANPLILDNDRKDAEFYARNRDHEEAADLIKSWADAFREKNAIAAAATPAMNPQARTPRI